MIKVLIVDDHELVRTGISRMLEDTADIQVVGVVNNGEDALTEAKNLDPDVVLMDVQMPGIGGLEATHRLRRQSPEIKIIAVTVCNDEPFPSRFLQAGASGYITKDTELADMLKAIRSVYAGERYLSPAIAQQLALRQIDRQGGTPFDALSDRELQIMLMVVKGESVQVISEKLCLSPKTINSYRYRVFDKLNIDNDVEFTLLALRYGMIDVANKSQI